ncbi:MAG: hypothetical protein AAFY48_00790 [Bacteroidota bacterium]
MTPNITTSLAELQAYFVRLGEIHPDIKQVVIGDSDQIISLDRSQLEYPLLWVETPRVDWLFDPHPQRYYNLSFVILLNTAVDNWQREQYVLHRSLEITEQLIAKMQSDDCDNLINLRDAKATSDPILGYGHDNDFGYRTSLRIRAYMQSSAPPVIWNDPCPVGALARFVWTNNSPGDFTDITFTDASLPEDESWGTLWTWQIDDGPTQGDENPPPNNLGAGNYLYVTLTITSGSCTLTASNLIYASSATGGSVPKIIDKKLIA